MKGFVRYADLTPATGYHVLLSRPGVNGLAVQTVNAAGTVTFTGLPPTTIRLGVDAPGGAYTAFGWIGSGATLSADPVDHVLLATGTQLEFDVVLPFLPDGTPADPPTGPEPGDDPEPGDEPGDGDPIACTHPLDGQPVPCDIPADELCLNPFTGQYERCDEEAPCYSATGLPVACDAPECAYGCDEPDLPDTNTVPESETETETDLETLALTGANWQGVAVIAGAFLLLGAGIRLTVLLQRRRETR